MQPNFWHQRWADNQIGFHQSAPTPLLVKHWAALGVDTGASVFVPLCGKSLDMAWLASQGYRVLGVELSQVAVEQFFAEHGLTPEIEASSYGRHYRAGGIEIICGDAFGLDATVLGACTAVFDRAAMIALPPPMRARYSQEVYARLPAGCRGLLVTLEYPQDEREGPPFAITESEVRERYALTWDVDLLERTPIQLDHPGHLGVSSLDAVAYSLRRR
jgi:thiopurine S-methyltransferase